MNGTERSSTQRRLSRETRHLLIAALAAILALWVLARLRFPDRSVTPNPIPQLLTQLSARPGLSEIASEIGRVQMRLSSSLLVAPAFAVHPASGGSPFPALRIRPDVAMALLPRVLHVGAAGADDLLAFDPATGLAVLSVPSNEGALVPAPWSAEGLDQPRFFAATIVALDRVALGPVFVAGLQPERSPAWSGPVWVLPSATDVAPGSMLFTVNGEIVGAVARHHDGLAVIPGDTLLADAQRLLDRGRVVPGDIGLRAQELTPSLAAATRASSGVIVTWVDPEGPAAAGVSVGDVVESLNGARLESLDEWDVRSSRLSAGEAVALDVRRRGASRHIPLVAAAIGEPARAGTLGLNLRYLSGLGSEVLDVDAGSAAAAAGLRAGDLISSIDTARRPTPARVRQVYASADDGQSILVGVTRGDSHRVVAVVK